MKYTLRAINHINVEILVNGQVIGKLRKNAVRPVSVGYIKREGKFVRCTKLVADQVAIDQVISAADLVSR